MEVMLAFVLGLFLGSTFPSFIKPALVHAWEKVKGFFNGNP